MFQIQRNSSSSQVALAQVERSLWTAQFSCFSEIFDPFLQTCILVQILGNTVLANQEISQIVISSGKIALFGLFIVLFGVVGVRLNEKLQAVFVLDSPLVDEAQIGESIQMAFRSSFFIVFNASSNFSIPVGVESIEKVFEVQKPFLEILANFVETLGVPLLGRPHKIFKGLAEILCKPFTVFMENP